MIVIMKKGNRPQPPLPACYTFMNWEALNRHHPNTDLCKWGTKQKQRRLVEEEARVGSDTVFRAYGELMEMVKYFRYLGQLLTVI